MAYTLVPLDVYLWKNMETIINWYHNLLSEWIKSCAVRRPGLTTLSPLCSPSGSSRVWLRRWPRRWSSSRLRDPWASLQKPAGSCHREWGRRSAGSCHPALRCALNPARNARTGTCWRQENEETGQKLKTAWDCPIWFAEGAGRVGTRLQVKERTLKFTSVSEAASTLTPNWDIANVSFTLISSVWWLKICTIKLPQVRKYNLSTVAYYESPIITCMTVGKSIRSAKFIFRR